MTKVILPRLNQTGPNEWSDVESNDVALREVINGGIDTENLKPSAGITADQLADAAKLGLTGSSKVRRGKAVVTAEQTLTSTTFEYMPTPDRVKEVEVPEDGLLWIAYSGSARATVENAGRAGLFIGPNQVKFDNGTGIPLAQELSFSTNLTHVVTSLVGLTGNTPPGGWNEVTTGLTIGLTSVSNSGPIVVQVAPGTYDVGVKFRATNGSVVAKGRRLWVKSENF